LKEKILAARRAKIKTVIIPHLNKNDLAELPKNLREFMEIVPVEEVKQVLSIALVLTSHRERDSHKKIPISSRHNVRPNLARH